MFELFFNTRYRSPWDHLDNDEVLVPASDPVGYFTHLFFSFEGRISRLEYLGGMLTSGVVTLTVYLVTALLFGARSLDVVATASIVPVAWTALALEVKRWHDQGRSGWWVLLRLLPFVGGPVKLVMLGLVPSDGPNDYDFTVR